MKIWFGTTTLKYCEYKDYYQKIRQYLIDLGNILTDDWVGDHGQWVEENPGARRDIRGVYRAVTKAIDEADASIIEFTVPNFSSSHQITYTLQQRKPVLVLRLHSENPPKDSYLEALESPLLTVAYYNLETYTDIIDEFLGYARVESGLGRYNIMLDKKHKYYLDWAAAKYKISRSKLIGELARHKMESDQDFGIYLSSPLP